MTDLDKALALALNAHAGQKYNDRPYIEHVQAVVAAVVANGGTEAQTVIAALHDTVEDTRTTLAELETTFGAEIAAGVDALTRRAGEEYQDYIARAAQHRDARLVKVCDLLENLGQSYAPDAPAKALSLRRRYQRALVYLATH